MEKKEEMNTKEMAIAAEWLKEHGHTDEEIIEFINYVAFYKRPVKVKENNTEKE